ncbi:MAG: hypothetical protein K0V04_08665 [Deltaproteobacteria bacterium]|nr:hypothetical protein [Deltaproteobacteria bacterium]
MLAGHFATAIIAKQHGPRAPFAFYLVVSQLPDLLWLTFHFLGLEPTGPDNIMTVSLDTLAVDMTYSHDLLPMLGWIALVVVAGRALFGTWRPGWIGGAVLVVHALTDYIAGHPHNVFGPETHAVGTGMYQSAPYVAVGIEAVFIAVATVWILRVDAKAGVRRSPSTYRAWVAVFVGGVVFMLSTAELSMVEMTGLEPIAALSGSTVPGLALTYLIMFAAMLWAETRPLVGQA